MARGVLRTAAGLCVAAVLCAAASCNIVGPAYLLVHGPEKVPAVYELDPTLPTVIFVDDRGSRVSRRTLRLLMAQEAEKTLLGEKKLRDVISAQSALSAAAADRDDTPMSIAEIGRSVGASIVIYAAMDQFSLAPDGQTFLPTAQFRVKVIDARSDKRLWPEERAGHLVATRSPVAGEISPGVNEQARAEDELARRAGLDLARLFYAHVRDRGASGNE